MQLYYTNGAHILRHHLQICCIVISAKRPRGGGGTSVHFAVQGNTIFKVLFQTVTELWVSLSQIFGILLNYECPFQGIFHDFQNYGSDFGSICRIMPLKSTRIYGIMGTNFSGKMAGPRQMMGCNIPPPPERKTQGNLASLHQEQYLQLYKSKFKTTRST